MASHSSQAASNSGSATEPLIGPPTYLPCIHAAHKLDPITISQMKNETHHRGKRVAVRVLFPPIRKVGLAAFIEDEEGTKTWLQVLNQPSEKVVPAEQTLRFGSCYLIKEPFATADPPGDYSLRVDHPGDIFPLPLDHELVPAKWRKSEGLVGRSHEMRLKGNDAVGKKRWAEAEVSYTTAARIAETAEEMQLAYLNRSLTNLQLGRPAAALADAIKSYKGDNSARTEKGLFREASALYQLAKYDQCLDRLQALRSTYPTNNSALPMIERAQVRLQEQQMGHYDFRRMYKQAETTPPLIDCATYTMPVEIRDSPGNGRGVFATKKVLAGEMLICEKAFGYIHGRKDGASGKMTDLEDIQMQVDLCAQISQRLFHNIEDARLFGDLHHGDFKTVPVYEVDGKPVVDSHLVARIITLTSYRAPRTNLSLIGDLVSMDVKALEGKECSLGIWSFISHINHSCVSNVERSFIGDMQIIRATRDLEIGAELLISYIPALPFESYDEAQKRLSAWGFICGCSLCLDRKATPERVLMERKSLLNEFFRFMGNIPKAQQALDRLNQTYSATAKEAGAIRMELWTHYRLLGGILADMGKPSEAIEMTLRGLEALGFVITANPRRGVAKASKPELRVRQWGLANWISVDAFHALHLAYKGISSENSAAARGYLELAYAMFVGEKDTILDTYPTLG